MDTTRWRHIEQHDHHTLLWGTGNLVGLSVLVALVIDEHRASATTIENHQKCPDDEKLGDLLPWQVDSPSKSCFHFPDKK